MQKAIKAWLASGFLLASFSAQAQAISIINPSFEDNLAPNGGFPVLNPNGWSRYDPAGIINQGANAVGVLNPTGTTFYVDPTPHGNNVALVYLEQRRGTNLTGDSAGFFQTLTGNSLTLNTRYTLNVAVGNIASGIGLGAFAPFGFANLSGFPGYRVELLAGGEVVASDNNSLVIGDGRFATSSVVLDVRQSHDLAGQTLGIRLINLNLATGNPFERAREVNFDNASLVAAPIPELPPSALYLAGLALIGSIALRRGRG
ncbi:MAG: hypothetical protein ACKVQQ_14550 [Burkholderiales bacterium]